METYADRIIIEVSGHEHLADVRYSNGSVIFNETHNQPMSNRNLTFVGPSLYHNMIISPGLTAFDAQNPGFTLFTLNLTS